MKLVANWKKPCEAEGKVVMLQTSHALGPCLPWLGALIPWVLSENVHLPVPYPCHLLPLSTSTLMSSHGSLFCSTLRTLERNTKVLSLFSQIAGCAVPPYPLDGPDLDLMLTCGLHL